VTRATALAVAVAAAAAVGSPRAGAATATERPRALGLYPATGPALALVESQVEVLVRGPIAEVHVTQRFHNRADHATEATYVFPLPADAAVSAMWIRTGARTLRATVERRDEAMRRYEDAIRRGVPAALLDQERPDVLTQAVAAIPARGTVEIALRYDTLAQYRGGVWELALPLVVAPRYVPGVATARPTTGSGRAPDTDRAPDASRVTPPGSPGAGGATDVVIAFADRVRDPTSPTHELQLRPAPPGAAAAVAFTDPRTDHDAVVRWRADAPAAGWVEDGPEGAFAAVVVEAPAPPPRRGPVRCLVVLDRSAVARGDAEAAARPFTRALLAALDGADRVALAGLGTGWLAPRDAARAHERAWDEPSGAFDLSRALAAARPAGAPVVLITGALVADDAAAVAAARRLGVPVHAIGVGAAPARGLLAELAAATGGTLRVLVPGDDLAAAARAVIADVAAAPPPLAVQWGTLAARDVVPGALPRAGAGQAQLVIARVRAAHAANGRAGGSLFAIEPLPAARPVEGAPSRAGPLARRWARGRLEELLAQGAAPAVVTAHALRFGLVSPHTSLVVVGEEVVVAGGMRRTVAVPVSVPAGMPWPAVKKQLAAGRGAEAPPPPPPPPPPGPERRGGEARAAGRGAAQLGDTRALDDDGRAQNAVLDRVEREARDLDEAVEARPVTGAAVSAAGRSVRRGLRVAVALGGGVAWPRDPGAGAAPLLALTLRAMAGARAFGGIAGGLWLTDRDGIDLQGQLLVIGGVRGLGRGALAERLELGAGAGLHGGAGTGPAIGGYVRAWIAPRLAPFLRYDGALLRRGDPGGRALQSAITLGIEYGY
jgi:Ca-activated chloride channel family protein